MPHGSSRISSVGEKFFMNPSSRRLMSASTPMRIDSPTKCSVSAVTQVHGVSRT